MLAWAGAWTTAAPAQRAVPAPTRGDADVVERILSVAGEGFHLRTTDHFVIGYDTDYAVLRGLIGRLEGTYDATVRFCDAYRLHAAPRVDRLGVILFGSFETYAEAARRFDLDPSAVAGFYSQESNLAMFCDVADTPALRPIAKEIARLQERIAVMNGSAGGARGDARRQGVVAALTANRAVRDRFVDQFNRFVIQHEAVHQVLFNIGVHPRGAAQPTWLVEGLACQFEVPQTERSGRLRQINHMRLADFRDALGAVDADNGIDAGAVADAVASGRLLPLRSLIGDDGAFRNAGDATLYRYAQAWALTYYVSRERPDGFSNLLRDLAARRRGVAVGADEELETFERAFGRVDEPFESSWIAFVMGLRFDPREAGR
jgi:hypothetical protein